MEFLGLVTWQPESKGAQQRRIKSLLQEGNPVFRLWSQLLYRAIFTVNLFSCTALTMILR
jgi:hypothetical protein